MFPSPKRSALLSGMLHCGAILLILAVTGVKPQLIQRARDIIFMPSDLAPYKLTDHSAGGGGGGGGMHTSTPASLGERPRFAARQFVVPTAVPDRQAPLMIDPTLIGVPEVQLVNYAQYGDPNGILSKFSAGPGKGGGIGTGDGTGDGPGKGPGYGPGEGGNEGGGVRFLGTGGGSITAPTLVSKVEPQYSEEARKAKLQGTVLLRIEVDTQGRAQNFSVRQSLGLGLDDCAIQAVKKWKFLPGKINGKPAVVEAYVEVNFRLL